MARGYGPGPTPQKLVAHAFEPVRKSRWHYPMMDKPKLTDRVDDLRRRSAEAEIGGGAGRREREHKGGKLTARERVALLLDESTFEELDKFVTHRCDDFGRQDQRPPGDGFVTGYGRIDGRLV